MKIGGKEYKEIQILTNDDELVASLMDEDAIIAYGYRLNMIKQDKADNESKKERKNARS